MHGKYRSDPRSSTFEKMSEWSEFEIKPQTESEITASEAFESTGRGNNDAEKLASYKEFAGQYPTDFRTLRVYSEILQIYLKTGDNEHALDFLKGVIRSPIVPNSNGAFMLMRSVAWKKRAAAWMKRSDGTANAGFGSVKTRSSSLRVNPIKPNVPSAPPLPPACRTVLSRSSFSEGGTLGEGRLSQFRPSGGRWL